MGNKLGKRRQVVDEKYTRPQGLYQIKDVDYKKLRKLILESKLAPCYPGGDDCDCTLLEECPICFLYWPQSRDNEFDLDLEDIMVMEAIWLSIQENGRAGQSSCGDAVPEQDAAEDYCMSPARAPMAGSSSSSPSGGLACAITALVERRQLTGETSINYSAHASPSDILPSSSRSLKRVKKNQRNQTQSFSSSKEMYSTMMSAADACRVGHVSEMADVSTSYTLPPPPLPPLLYGRRNSKRVKNIQRKYKYSPLERTSSRDIAEEWEFDHGSVVAEAGTTYASSDDLDESDGGECLPPPPPPPLQYSDDGGFQTAMAAPIVPESFEEQMMMAMATSLAEARARTTAHGVAWQ